MSYKLDYEETIPKIVERLSEEHREIDNKLSRVARICRNREGGKLEVAISLLNVVSPEILRHAVEEEALVARAIMKQKATRTVSAKSVSVLQEHRRIKEFIEETLPYLSNEAAENKARKEILRFIDELSKHHQDEEEVVFPLALKAELLLTSKPILESIHES